MNKNPEPLMIKRFVPNKSTILCEIMSRNKSDKGGIDYENSWHNYTTFYDVLFKERRFESNRIFELGLGTNNVNIESNMGENGKPCASLYGWSEYFPNSKIYGADIDKNILVNNDKFKTFYCDQTSVNDIKKLWENIELFEDFDIIIDDGLHNFDANICFFENSIHKLNINGYYIIEDISLVNLEKFINKINELSNKMINYEFNLLNLYSKNNNWDNNLLVIKRTF